jgi:hypothetical protein
MLFVTLRPLSQREKDIPLDALAETQTVTARIYGEARSGMTPMSHFNGQTSSGNVGNAVGKVA